MVRTAGTIRETLKVLMAVKPGILVNNYFLANPLQVSRTLGQPVES